MSSWTAMDLMQKSRTYTDKDGNEKGVWVPCGTLWLKDGAPCNVTLHAVPVPTVDRKTERLVISLAVFEKRDRPEPSKGQTVPAEDIPF